MEVGRKGLEWRWGWRMEVGLESGGGAGEWRCGR